MQNKPCTFLEPLESPCTTRIRALQIAGSPSSLPLLDPLRLPHLALLDILHRFSLMTKVKFPQGLTSVGCAESVQ